MDEVVAVGDGDLCRWFATIFARELPGQVIDAYIAGAAAPYLDAMSTRCDIAIERIVLEDAVEGWSDLADATRQLATDFGSLFLVPGKAAALPFASYHEEQTLFGAAHDRMVDRLAAAGLSVAGPDNGPADHLAVMLEYLAHLLESDVPTPGRQEYLQEELLPFTEAFARNLRRKAPSSSFYPSVAIIMNCYLRSLAPVMSEDL
jgi:TorA-specific chaperone